MTEDQKKLKMDEYARECVKLGELMLQLEITNSALMDTKKKAHDLLKEIKNG